MWKSSPERYGRMAIALHWTTAALIIGLMISGFRAASTIDIAEKASLLRIHAPVGMAVLALTLARIAWWRLADVKPLEPAGMSRLQAIGAKAVHGLLYAVILGMVGSGIALFVMSGAGAILAGNAPGPLPDFWSFPPRYGHATMVRLMLLLLLLHLGAALYHQFIRKDRLFARMGVGQ